MYVIIDIFSTLQLQPRPFWSRIDNFQTYIKHKICQILTLILFVRNKFQNREIYMSTGRSSLTYIKLKQGLLKPTNLQQRSCKLWKNYQLTKYKYFDKIDNIFKMFISIIIIIMLIYIFYCENKSNNWLYNKEDI